MAYDRDLSFIYRNPTKIIFGEDAVGEVGLEVGELGCSKAFVVTDPGIVGAGLAEKVVKALGNKYAGTFDQCIQDCGLHIINEAAEVAKGTDADCLVSVGGGSTIDTAKGMAILLKEGGQIEDYSGLQLLDRPQTPHVVIPTTTGTGSEVTYAFVVKDWNKNQKLIYADTYVTPNTAILDPKMVAGLPPNLTATTGMDAFTHSVEAIHALQAEPISDGMGMHAIRLLMEYLPACVEKGDDLLARGQTQIAATIAGVAFSNAQIGMVHALAHTLGGLFKVPHGLANSILLPHVMLYNMDECADRYVLVAQAMGIDTRGMSDEEAARAAVDGIWELTRKLGVPQKVSEVGVPESGLEEAAEMAMYDGSIVYNPKLIYEPAQILEVYKNAF